MYPNSFSPIGTGGASYYSVSDFGSDVTAVNTAVQTGADLYGTLFGGSDQPKDCAGRRWCAGRPTDAQINAVRAQRTIPAHIKTHWANSRGKELGLGFDVAPACEIGYWLMGNRDCKHSDPQGAVVQRDLLDLIASLGGAVSGAPSGAVPSGDTGGVTDTSIWGHVADIGQDIKDVFGNILGGAATGAVQGAKGAAAGASAGSDVGRDLSTTNPIIVMTLIGIAVFAVVYFLRKGGR